MSKSILLGILQVVLILIFSLNSFAESSAKDYEVETLLDEFGCRGVCQVPGFRCVGYLPELSLDDEKTQVWEEKLGYCEKEKVVSE